MPDTTIQDRAAGAIMGAFISADLCRLAADLAAGVE